jgi:hypothetical protein
MTARLCLKNIAGAVSDRDFGSSHTTCYDLQANTLMRQHAARTSTLIALLVTLLASSRASALDVSYTDRGWYSPTGFHNPNNVSYIAGDTRGAGCITCVSDARNFFVFDLASVTQPIAAAKLAILVPSQPGPGYVSADLSENYELHDVVTPIAALRDGTGGVAAYSDLGGGAVYGSRAITAADVGNVVEITLNASAVSALDAATGLVGIGGSITTLDAAANDENAFAWTNTGMETAQLRLTFVSGPPGDFNFDGLVDARDYAVWRKTGGTQANYNLWRAHFGQTIGSGSSFGSTVPEPSTVLLLAIAMISLLGDRKAKSRG